MDEKAPRETDKRPLRGDVTDAEGEDTQGRQAARERAASGGAHAPGDESAVSNDADERSKASQTPPEEMRTRPQEPSSSESGREWQGSRGGEEQSTRERSPGAPPFGEVERAPREPESARARANADRDDEDQNGAELDDLDDEGAEAMRGEEREVRASESARPSKDVHADDAHETHSSEAESETESEAAREASRQRRRLESTLRDVMRRAIERGVDAGLGALEQSVDVLERSVEAGRGSVKSANSRLRDVIDDVRIPKELPKEFSSLPKDVVNMLFTQLDEGKSILVGAVAKEVREFLDETDVAYELQRVLTSISFEISTEIRFVPNERGVPRAEVSSKARPKVSSRRVRKRARDDEEDA